MSPGLLDQEFDVLLDQLLEALVVGNGGLEFGHLVGRHIAGDIAAVFVALMIVVRAVGALAEDADGAAVEALEGWQKSLGEEHPSTKKAKNLLEWLEQAQ